MFQPWLANKNQKEPPFDSESSGYAWQHKYHSEMAIETHHEVKWELSRCILRSLHFQRRSAFSASVVPVVVLHPLFHILCNLDSMLCLHCSDFDHVPDENGENRMESRALIN